MTVAARRDVFQAIADPTRRQIISMVVHKPMTLNEIAGQFDISRPAVSQQVKILMECGVLIIKKEGRERVCEAKLEGFAEITTWVEYNKKLWAARFNTMDSLLTELKQAKKTKTVKRK